MKSYEYNIDTFYLFIDFREAYDSFEDQAMNELCIPKPSIELTEMALSEEVCHVKIQNLISDWFETPIRGETG